MEVTAKLKNLRVAPRKVRAVADLVRGRKINAALDQLSFSGKQAAKPLAKLINSAVANAKNNFALTENNLYIKTITVDGGATIKRWRPRAQGRATPINKRTSHINVILAELLDSAAVKKADVKQAAKPLKVKAAVKEDEGLKIEEHDKILKEAAPAGSAAAKDKEIVDPRREARGQHAKVEGGKRGFTTKVFRRKSG